MRTVALMPRARAEGCGASRSGGSVPRRRRSRSSYVSLRATRCVVRKLAPEWEERRPKARGNHIGTAVAMRAAMTNATDTQTPVTSNATTTVPAFTVTIKKNTGLLAVRSGVRAGRAGNAGNAGGAGFFGGG